MTEWQRMKLLRDQLNMAEARIVELEAENRNLEIDVLNLIDEARAARREAEEAARHRHPSNGRR